MGCKNFITYHKNIWIFIWAWICIFQLWNVKWIIYWNADLISIVAILYSLDVSFDHIVSSFFSSLMPKHWFVCVCVCGCFSLDLNLQSLSIKCYSALICVLSPNLKSHWDSFEIMIIALFIMLIALLTMLESSISSPCVLSRQYKE